MAENKSSLNNMLQAVLSTALTEQNATYPPGIYTAHYNAVASYLISTIAESVPHSNSHVDIISPFLKKEKIKVQNGVVQMPDDYRNIWGTPGVSVKKDMKGECNEVVDEKEFKEGVKKSGCQTRPVDIVNPSEWDNRTTSTYKYPTYKDPIGCFFGRELKICPYDFSFVEVRYIRQEKKYQFGYIMQPDDTYIFDPNTSIDTEFTSAAFKPLFKGISAMYAAYTRDPSAREWSAILKTAGIL